MPRHTPHATQYLPSKAHSNMSRSRFTTEIAFASLATTSFCLDLNWRRRIAGSIAILLFDYAFLTRSVLFTPNLYDVDPRAT